MNIRPILNDTDLKDAIKEIERLWGSPLGTPDGDKLDVLATLVDAYESKSFPIRASTPLEMLQYAVTDMGHSQKELAELLGSRSQASDLLRGRRRISLEIARKISTAWHIPIQLLIQSDVSGSVAA